MKILNFCWESNLPSMASGPWDHSQEDASTNRLASASRLLVALDTTCDWSHSEQMQHSHLKAFWDDPLPLRGPHNLGRGHAK